MDGIREFLEIVRDNNLIPGRLRGLLHIAIGRRITKADGTIISAGLTWRELSNVLKTVRIDKELVKELGAEPDELSPRDRQRMWYSAIAVAKVDSAQAFAEADELTVLLKPLGYTIGPPPPGAVPPNASTSKPKQKSTPHSPPPPPPPKKKK